MKLFRNYTLTWRQAGLLKFCMLCIGIAIGATWPLVFVAYTVPLIALAVLIGIYLAYVVWARA